MKLISACVIAVILSTPAAAQNLGEAFISGIAAKMGTDALKHAPEAFGTFLESSKGRKTYGSEEECLGALQLALNAGTVMSNMLPFSSVTSLEDTRGPVGRFRLMIDGKKHHFDASCDQAQLTREDRPWDDIDDAHSPDTRSSIDAGAGLLMLLRQSEDETGIVSTDRGNLRPSRNSISPPLSQGEEVGLVAQILPCWNIGALSTDAARTTVEVSFNIMPDGTPVASSIRLQDISGGSDVAGRQAYEAAKRAIIRCGSRGYDLPMGKITGEPLTIVFDPMRSR